MKSIKTIIVDDEQLGRSVVREYLSAHKDFRVVAECANGFDAVKAVAELRPDVMFLDIQMPKLSGFEVLELLENPPAIVFVTAHDQFALKAFDKYAVDYLLKPVGQARFDDAVRRVQERLKKSRTKNLLPMLQSVREHQSPLERIIVKEGTRVVVIPVESIDYVEAQDDYVEIHAEGKKHLKQERMNELEHELDGTKFVRVHRSFILNIDRIARIEPYGKESRVAILKDGAKLTISRAGYDKLKSLL
jgi:two-component system LytT family response regulator